MKTPIKYFGGKGTMFKNIVNKFPSEYNTYIEPFGGSYSVGLSLNPPPPIEIYNDLEKNVYTLYKVLSDKDLFCNFKKLCDLSLYSEELRKEYKILLKNEILDDVKRAFYYFYINRTSHNGTGGFSVNKVVRRNMSKSVSDFLSSIDRLDELHLRLSRIIIRNTDGIELIRKYNDNSVFIYADPPYEQSTRTSARYVVDMDNEKQKEFLDVCKESKSKILISAYACDLYDELLNHGFKRYDFSVKTIGGDFKKKNKIETLYYNYE
jgi:DNA adenine methylase